MLDAEERRTRLAAIADDNWREAAVRRVRRLRRRLRPLAEPFLEPTGWAGDYRARLAGDARRRQAAATLDELSGKDRLAVFTALHPRLGAALAAWWVAARAEPYLTGWTRRAYRSPDDFAITRRARTDHLHHLVATLGPYDQDAVWVAAWGPGVGPDIQGDAFTHRMLGPLLAAVIDQGGPEGEVVLQTLIAVGNGEHPIGVMGRHVIVGLLRAHRPEGWEFIERLLLAVQRQEGLRQAILESADEGAPEAFDRIVDLVLEHDLLRFASSVRAAGVWIGFAADVTEIPLVDQRVRRLQQLRRDRSAAHAAIASSELWDVFVGLSAVAMDDVTVAVELARVPFVHPDPDIRAATIRFLSATSLVSVVPWFFAALDDPDLGVAALAFATVSSLANSFAAHAVRELPAAAPADAFERLERLAGRYPEAKRTVAARGVETGAIELDREEVVAQLMVYRETRPVSRLIPWLPAMGPWSRGRFAGLIRDEPVVSPEMRATLIKLVGDRSARVRESAVAALAEVNLSPSEAPELEGLLSRKAGDLRRGVITLLLSQRAEDALASVERLWASGNGPRRDAACELLGQIAREEPEAAARTATALAADGPSAGQLAQLIAVPGCVGGDEARASERRATRPSVKPAPSGHTEDTTVPRPAASAPSGPSAILLDVDAGLGLYDPERLTPTRPPRAAAHQPSPVAGRIVSVLDDLAEQYRDTSLTVTSWQGTEDVLLADADHRLPHPFRSYGGGGSGGMVLSEVFRGWWSARPEDLRSQGSLDALDALAFLDASGQGRSTYEERGEGAWWLPVIREVVGGQPGQLRHRIVVEHVLLWLALDEVVAGPDVARQRCVDGIEAVGTAIPSGQFTLLEQSDVGWPPRAGEWRGRVDGLAWSTVLLWLLGSATRPSDDEAMRRWFALVQWLDRPTPQARRHRARLPLLLWAYEHGVANEHDMFDALMAPHSRTFAEWTRRRRAPFVTAHPEAAAVADRLRDRVIEIERARGELPTPATPLAVRVGSVEGADLVLELLARLGRSTLVRGYAGRNEGREAVFSHLLQVSYPADGDDAESFRAGARARKLKDNRLIDLAVFAPQWAALIEEALGWDGLADGVWWYHAHTKDDRWAVDADVRETWAALSAERTPLAGEDLVAGAVDVDWYVRARGALGEDRWKVLHKAAKLASGGSGHRRAQLFAEAMNGSVAEAAILERIRSKRHQDSVRALGLLPLPSQAGERDAAVLARYQILCEFERGSQAFGSQRQASEATAVRIGVENLARAAGYPDPQRFVWAMEAAEAGDLADGPVTVTDGDLSVTLSVDAEGTPRLAVARGAKALAAVPAAHRKAPAIAELRARKTSLTRQATRVRASLEAAMVRGDAFAPSDLTALERHPVVAPMLDLLVFADEDGHTFRRVDGRLVDVSGQQAAPSGGLCIAHPVDLAGSNWSRWQEQIYGAGQKQPFRQVFRELYAPTEAERSTGPRSLRWAGHQIQPRQSAALFGRRGWLVDRESGEVSRVFHAHDTVARVGFVDGFGTAAEVELPTVDAVYFTRRGSYLAEPLGQVPPIVFSEAMRDLDLVISVAHAGGVDPEATASTVEMRAALIRETTRMLKLDNVREVDSHVVIEGKLGEYSVHLGSGSVHRRPGGAICIIPVDAQRRGRIFLPFADDDPKTAEVLAKVLLLARDHTIKDPSILEQLRS